jgi:type III secretion protein N (ATPase)
MVIELDSRRSPERIAESLRESIAATPSLEIRGRVRRIIGTIIEANVPHVRVGEICILRNHSGEDELSAEVVGFDRDAALLTPIGEMRGLSSTTEVIPTGRVQTVGVGPALLGRVLDALGRPLDEATKGPMETTGAYPVYADPPDPLKRKLIDRPLALKLRVFDGLLTLGEGQRMGIFGAAGAGKSTLMGSIVKGAEVDVVVVALIGERGREVREFIEDTLGPEGMAHTVLVVATSDRSPLERAKAAYVATAIAEYHRDQDKRVLLLMDSVTRFARALREIGLAAGEPPTRRGFPPSVFATLPKLLERAGQSDRGSISALYTILVEGDDMAEPIADETRSILDGHIVLSRELAHANHYPAVDMLASASRVMGSITTKEHREAAGRFRQLLAKYGEIELLVRIGEYKRGGDKLADEALDKIDQLNAFLKQGRDEYTTFDETVARLREIVG